MDTKKILALAFIAIAIISLVFAIVCFSLDEGYVGGSTESNQSYGGDAYTGIQNAAAQTATNVYYLNRSVRQLASCVKTVGGLVFIVVALVFGTLGFTKLQDIQPINFPGMKIAAPEQENAAQEETAPEEQ